MPPTCSARALDLGPIAFTGQAGEYGTQQKGRAVKRDDALWIQRFLVGSRARDDWVTCSGALKNRNRKSDKGKARVGVSLRRPQSRRGVAGDGHRV